MAHAAQGCADDRTAGVGADIGGGGGQVVVLVSLKMERLKLGTIGLRYSFSCPSIFMYKDWSIPSCRLFIYLHAVE